VLGPMLFRRSRCLTPVPLPPGIWSRAPARPQNSNFSLPRCRHRKRLGIKNRRCIPTCVVLPLQALNCPSELSDTCRKDTEDRRAMNHTLFYRGSLYSSGNSNGDSPTKNQHKLANTFIAFHSRRLSRPATSCLGCWHPSYLERWRSCTPLWKSVTLCVRPCCFTCAL
jgi:hypothetical protein